MTGWRTRAGPAAYVAWAAVAVALSLKAGGLSPENTTRLSVLGLLGVELLLWRPLVRVAQRVRSPRARYVALGVPLAALVEGFHMISAPVFPSLRVAAGAGWTEALRRYAVDLAFTVPAYVVILHVMWWLTRRLRFTPWTYAVVMGLAQTLGDGGLWFFAGAPALLGLLPYPMTNYHAMNVLPYLAVRADVEGTERRGGAWVLVTVPAVMATYAVCGALIQWVGRWLGVA